MGEPVAERAIIHREPSCSTPRMVTILVFASAIDVTGFVVRAGADRHAR